jgi:lysine-N-methylase
VARIGEREWAFLACADGTRTLEGIALAAARRDRRATPDHVAAFFAQLEAAGMLVDGPAQAPPSEPERDDARWPPAPLPGFRLVCDGRGTCCRLYPTTTFLPLDAVRARACCPDVLDGGNDPPRLFTPVSSSHAEPWEPLAVAMVDGRCAFLDAGGSCRIHAAGDAGAKPSGCRAFPFRYVDDGRELRVAPAPECSCVFTSSFEPSPSGEGVSEAAPAPEAATFVERLGDELRRDERTSWDRGAYLSWADGIRARLRREDDGVAALWCEADELATTELTLEAMSARLRATLHRHNDKQTWRSERDLARRIPAWMEAALGEPASPEPLLGENLYLRAIAHVHAWALDGVPVATSLRNRALRLRIARALPLVISDGDRRADPALAHPIALVEACCRAFHLDG